MKNIFKIIFILSLTIFAVTGCADDSGGNGGGNGEVYTQEFTKLISIGGLSYGETADGKKYAWGNVGELTGAGNTDNIRTPKEVDFTIIYNITNVSTYYILTDTGLYAWGNNGNGQVGNGTTDNVLTPYKVAGIDGNIKDIIVDYTAYVIEDTVYVLTDTGLYAWGYNGNGQVGNGTSGGNVLTPHKVEGIDGNIKEVIDNIDTVYVLTYTGLYAWGANSSGQVGNGTSGSDVLTPHKVVNGNIKEFIISGDDSLATYYAVTEDGLYAWGNNGNGQVGNGTSGGNVLAPHKVAGIDGNIKEVIAIIDTVHVLTDTGLYAWGANSSGQVGNGTSGSDVLTPHKVEGIDGNIKEVITNGDGSTVYVLTDTGLYAWGVNSIGQVGNGTTEDVLTPHKVEGIDGNIKEVITNGSTVYVLTDTGLYAWGNNDSGQVGNGKTENVLTPHKVEGIDGNIKEVITNGFIVHVLTDTGLYAWGNNSIGEVGNGTTENVLTPYKAVDGNIKEVITNGFTVYVLTDTGLYAWGDNYSGQIGNGTSGGNVLTPHKVEGIDGNIKEVITNVFTVYVLTDTGLYAWGDNSYGQVGNGTTDNVLTPYKVQIEKQN